ncbi:MAG: hypothetical protein ACK6AZ_16305, partial [Pseudanabaena sp.]
GVVTLARFGKTRKNVRFYAPVDVAYDIFYNFNWSSCNVFVLRALCARNTITKKITLHHYPSI